PGEALGRAYAPVLADTYADAWLAAAAALEHGGSVADAQRVLQATWLAARARAFRSEGQPSFSLILPEGAEPVDPAERSRVVELWRSFAGGLRGGRRAPGRR